MEQQIYYVDTFGVRQTHEVYNAALLEMCVLIFGHVECRVSCSSYVNMKTLLDEETLAKVCYKPVFVPEGNGRLSLLWRYLCGAWNIWKYLWCIPVGALLVIPYNNVFALRILNFLNKFRKRKIVVCCHGELEYLTHDRTPQGILTKLIARLVRSFFRNPRIRIADNLYFSILGEKLKENLASYISTDKIERFIVFDHPCLASRNPQSDSYTSGRISISTVGTLNKQKGADAFLEFVKAIPDDYRLRLSISVTGHVAGVDNEYLATLGVATLPVNCQMSREQLIHRLAKADYLLFLHSRETYAVTASGAVMDAITLGKPIIALENDYFNYLFSKYGRFGVLVPSPMVMVEQLTEILDGRFVPDTDFIYIRQQLSPASVAQQLREQLIRIGFIYC